MTVGNAPYRLRVESRNVNYGSFPTPMGVGEEIIITLFSPAFPPSQTRDLRAQVNRAAPSQSGYGNVSLGWQPPVSLGGRSVSIAAYHIRAFSAQSTASPVYSASVTTPGATTFVANLASLAGVGAYRFEVEAQNTHVPLAAIDGLAATQSVCVCHAPSAPHGVSVSAALGEGDLNIYTLYWSAPQTLGFVAAEATSRLQYVLEAQIAVSAGAPASVSQLYAGAGATLTVSHAAAQRQSLVVTLTNANGRGAVARLYGRANLALAGESVAVFANGDIASIALPGAARPPSAPVGLAATQNSFVTARNTRVLLSWSAPAAAGGHTAAIAAYKVEYKPAARANFADTLVSVGPVLSASLSLLSLPLTAGDTYHLRVFAKNAQNPNYGEPSNTITLTPALPPDNISGLSASYTATADATAYFFSLSWQAPNNGGASVIANVVSMRALDSNHSGYNRVFAGVTSTGYAVSTAPPLAFEFVVVPQNAVGVYGRGLHTVYPPNLPPSPPIGFAVASLGNQEVRLQWRRPQFLGGPTAAITAYDIAHSGGGWERATAVFAVFPSQRETRALQGLENEKPVTVSVRAVGVGNITGKAAVLTATPVPVVPDAPLSLQILGEARGDAANTVGFSFVAGSDGGGQITGVVIEFSHLPYSGGLGANYNRTIAIALTSGQAGSVTSAFALAPAVYTVNAALLNFGGAGAYGAPITFTVVANIPPPQSLSAIALTTQISLQWRQPAGSVNPPPEEYLISVGGGGTTRLFTVTNNVADGGLMQYGIGGLQSNTPYTIAAHAAIAPYQGATAFVTATTRTGLPSAPATLRVQSQTRGDAANVVAFSFVVGNDGGNSITAAALRFDHLPYSGATAANYNQTLSVNLASGRGIPLRRRRLLPPPYTPPPSPCATKPALASPARQLSLPSSPTFRRRNSFPPPRLPPTPPFCFGNSPPAASTRRRRNTLFRSPAAARRF